MIKKIFIGLLIILILINCSCSKENQGKDGYSAKIIRIGVGVTFIFAIHQLMHIDRVLEKHLPDDVKVEWVTFGNAAGAIIRDTIISNKMDIGAMSYTSYITAYENKMPLVLISGLIPQPSAIFSKRNDINSFKDIKEYHKIGMHGKGSNNELVFFLRSKEIFGNATKFSDNIVVISDSDMLSLLQGVDTYELYVLGFPAFQFASTYDNVKMIDDLSETASKYELGLLNVTTEDFYKKNPKLIEALRKATDETINYIRNNTEEAAIKLSENYYNNMNPQDILIQLNKCIPDTKIRNYDEIADILLDSGILSKPPKKFSELPFYEDIPK